MTTVVGHLVAKLGGDVTGLFSSLDETEERLQKFGASMANVGRRMTVGVTAPLLGIGTAALSSAETLNEGLANVASLGVAEGSIESFRASVQDMQVEFGKTSTDLTDGLYQVISSFGETAESADILRISAEAGVAGLATTEQALNLVATATLAYGESSAAAVQQASDLAFVAVKMGRTDFPQLSSALATVIQPAAAAGLGLETVLAATSALTLGGATTSQATTQLRGAIQALEAPTENMAGLLEEMGFASGRAMLAEMGLQGSLSAIVAAAEAAGQPLQSYIGSVEGQSAALALAGSQSESYANILAEMGNAAGATSAAFLAQSQGVNATGFQMQQLRQELATVSAQFGEQLVPALAIALDAATPLIQGLGRLVEGFTHLSPPMQKTILIAGGVVAAIGPLALGLSMLGPVITGVGAVLGVLGTALGVILSPIGLVATAIGALAFVVHDWATGGEKIPAMLESWGLEWLADRLRGVYDWADKAWAKITEMTAADWAETGWNLVSPPWIQTLFDWEWAELEPVDWVVDLLLPWSWPILAPVKWAMDLMGWDWPKLSQPRWLSDLLDFEWPSMPSLPRWLGGGGDEVEGNARGTANWKGGWTVVGEEGPELVDLPAGSAIHSADATANMLGNVSVTINNPTVRSDADIRALARAVGRELQRMRA